MQRQNSTISATRRRSLLIPALVLLTWLVYAQVWRYDFVNFDDAVYAFGNPFVLSGINSQSFRWAFSSESCALSANWFPLTWLSLMLDGQLYGQYAGGYHLTNVLIHTFNVVLLYGVLMRMTGERWKSSFVAGLFAVHPLHVESVAWISERKDVLSTFFGLISLWAYLGYARHRAWGWYTIALLAFTFSLLSKQMLVTLPFLLLMLDHWPLRRTPWAVNANGLWAAAADRGDDVPETEAAPAEVPFPPQSWGWLLLEKLPFLMLAVVFCIVVLFSQQQGYSMSTLEELSLDRRVSNALVVSLLYIAKFVWPSRLAVYYPYPDSIAPLHVMISCGILAAVTVAAVAHRRSKPYLIVGWLWYLGTLVPVIGLVQVGLQRMADRYTYIPSIGLSLMVAWLVPSLLRSRSWQKSVVSALATTVLLVLAAVAWVQTGYWRNSMTLFQHTLAITENNRVAHNNLGLAFRDRNRLHEAIQQFREALQVDPNYAFAHNNLGLVLRNQGRIDEAIPHFQAALRAHPEFSIARVNLGIALCLQGKNRQGVEQFHRVLESDPGNIRAHLCLATVLRELGEMDEARQHAEFVRSNKVQLPKFGQSMESQFRFPR